MPSLAAELRRSVASQVLDEVPARFLSDETESRGLRGRADALALPATTAEVAEVLAWCDGHDVPVVPRGGGTGYAAGAVPEGGLVLALDGLARVRSFDPLLWRMHVEAGVRTGALRLFARESGLLFPPDPGAAEQSQIGGNIATNAGGPHAFKYGVTGAWVTGLEAVLPSGEVIEVGGPIRKDVAGYDVKSLLIGSEGTLAVVTAAWLRLIPAPESTVPVVAFYPDVRSGCAAIESLLGSGLQPAALEFLDAGALAASRGAFPGEVPDGAAFAVLSEADGTPVEAATLRNQLVGVLAEGSLGVHVPGGDERASDLWRWRDGVSIAVEARRGGKVSEDIVVPVDRLAEAVEETVRIGERHGLPACSWGHAGDGNLHSTLLVERGDEAELRRAAAAAADLFALATRLGGSISGEHGIGSVKRGHLDRQFPAGTRNLQRRLKQVFDPKGLLNPGKKI